MFFRQIHPLTTEIPPLDSEVLFLGANFCHLVTKKFRKFLFSKCKFNQKNTKKNCQTFETTKLKKEKEKGPVSLEFMRFQCFTLKKIYESNPI
jgi:hypothetical protein